MVIALISHTSIGNASSAVTSAINTTAANFIIAGTASGAGASTGMSDSKGNTWVPLTGFIGPSGCSRLFYSVNPAVGIGHTFTYTGSFPAIEVAAFSGVATISPFDQQNGFTSGSSFVTATQPGSITPSVSGSLIIVDASFGSVFGTPTIDSGFTVLETVPETSSYGGILAYLIQSVAAPVNPTITAGSSKTTAGIASFKPGAGALAYNDPLWFGMTA